MKCEMCKISHNGTFGSGRFCTMKCARGFSTRETRSEISKKVSATMTGKRLTEQHKLNIQLANNFNRKDKIHKICLSCKKEIICRPSDRRKYCNQRCWINYTEKHKNDFLLYRQKCKFTFLIEEFPDKFDLALIKKHGKYSPRNKGNNLLGVSRDHIFSVKDGYIQNIDPKIISHPANCRIMLHKENQKKHSKSDITIDDLLNRIKNW